MALKVSISDLSAKSLEVGVAFEGKVNIVHVLAQKWEHKQVSSGLKSNHSRYCQCFLPSL